MSAQSTHKWCYNFWSSMFGSSSSLLMLDGEDDGLVSESVGNANLLSDHFDLKQSRESVDLPLTYHPSPNLITSAFR